MTTVVAPHGQVVDQVARDVPLIRRDPVELGGELPLEGERVGAQPTELVQESAEQRWLIAFGHARPCGRNQSPPSQGRTLRMA